MQETKFPGVPVKANKCEQWWWGAGGLVIGLILGTLLSMTVLKTSRRSDMPNDEIGGRQMQGKGTDAATGGSARQKKGQTADSDEQTPPSETPTSEVNEITTSGEEVTE